jgi:hypothetical protein
MAVVAFVVKPAIAVVPMWLFDVLRIVRCEELELDNDFARLRIGGGRSGL